MEFNNLAHENLGYTREEFEKLKIPDFEVVESPEETEAHIEKVVKRGSDDFETKHKTKDGDIRNIHVSSRTLSLQGKIYIQSIWRDITERIQAEEEIRNLAKFPSENPNPVLRVAKDGTILYVNDASKPLLDEWDCEIGQSLPASWKKAITESHNAGKSRIEEVNIGDRIFSFLMAPVMDEGYINLYGLDITERKQAEVELRVSQAKAVRGQQLLLALSKAAQAVQRARTTEEILRTVGEEISNLGYHTGIFTVTEDRKHLEASYMSFAKKSIRAAEKLTGISGKDYRFPIVEGGFFEKIIADGETVFKEQGDDFAYEALPKASRPLAGKLAELLGIQQIIFTPLTSGGETQGLLYVIGSDLSEVDTVTVSTFANQTTIALESIMLFEQVLHGRQRLQKLSRKLVVAQEKERRHIARELHDEIGQLLTGLKLTWEMSKQQKPKEAKVSRQEASDIIDELMVRVRDLSLDLLPAMLDDLGLIPTLEWHFERYSNQTNVQIDFEHSGIEERNLPLEVKTAAYRIVQEALTNIARHAGVNEAEVKIGVEKETLSIRIEDAGAGFDLKTAMEVNSTLGLVGMQERASSVGGRVTVKTRRRKGTRLLAELPIQGKFERRDKRIRK